MSTSHSPRPSSPARRPSSSMATQGAPTTSTPRRRRRSTVARCCAPPDGLLVWGHKAARVATGGAASGNTAVYVSPIEAVGLYDGYPLWKAFALGTETQLTTASHLGGELLSGDTWYHVYAYVRWGRARAPDQPRRARDRPSGSPRARSGRTATLLFPHRLVGRGALIRMSRAGATSTASSAITSTEPARSTPRPRSPPPDVIPRAVEPAGANSSRRTRAWPMSEISLWRPGNHRRSGDGRARDQRRLDREARSATTSRRRRLRTRVSGTAGSKRTTRARFQYALTLRTPTRATRRPPCRCSTCSALREISWPRSPGTVQRPAMHSGSRSRVLGELHATAPGRLRSGTTPRRRPRTSERETAPGTIVCHPPLLAPSRASASAPPSITGTHRPLRRPSRPTETTARYIRRGDHIDRPASGSAGTSNRRRCRPRAGRDTAPARAGHVADVPGWGRGGAMSPRRTREKHQKRGAKGAWPGDYAARDPFN